MLAYRYYCIDPRYAELVKYYVAWNCVYLLFGFVAFADRLAGYSWFLVPILVWFPVLKREKYSVGPTILLTAMSIALGVWRGAMAYFFIA
jgi:hypothetical protein